MNIFYVSLLLFGISHVLASLIPYGVYHVLSSKDTYKSLKQRMTIFLKSTGNKDPIASSPGCRRFKRAVQRRDMGAALSVFYDGSDELKKYCAEHLVSLGSPKLVELINRASSHDKSRLLHVILIHVDQQFTDKIFDALEPSNGFLSYVSFGAYLVCIPRKFTYLLGKMNDKLIQESTVEHGVSALFAKDKTEYLEPLLTALREETLLNKDLENIAIRKAFERASAFQNDRIRPAKRYFDHPAISATDYSNALYASYGYGVNQARELCRWLLDRADSQDLVAVTEDERFPMMQHEFQEAVNRALLVVDFDPRHGITIRRIEAIEALKSRLPDVLQNLVGDYIELHVADPEVISELLHRKGDELVHQKSKALLREVLVEYIPQDVLNIIDDY